MLRERGVGWHFVEFYGAGLAGLPTADGDVGKHVALFRLDLRDLPDLTPRRSRISSSPGVKPEQLALIRGLTYRHEQGLVAR